MNKAMFQKWRYLAETDERSLVLPDGCRDVLIISREGGPDEIVLTDFDIRPRSVRLTPGTEVTGYRLRPGASVDLRILDCIAADNSRTEDILGNELDSSNDLDEIIGALAFPNETVQTVSRNVGFSVRTVQRLFRDARLPPPDYWRLLGRARRAACILPSAAPLAEIACVCGFSDQSHMTREFVRWFGATPTQARQSPAVLDLLCQPALGNWTGEQISTR